MAPSFGGLQELFANALALMAVAHSDFCDVAVGDGSVHGIRGAVEAEVGESEDFVVDVGDECDGVGGRGLLVAVKDGLACRNEVALRVEGSVMFGTLEVDAGDGFGVGRESWADGDQGIPLTYEAAVEMSLDAAR